MIKKEDVKPGTLVKVDGVVSFDTGEPVLVVHHSVESVSGFSYYSEKKESCVFAIDKIEDNYVYITPIWKIYRDEHLDVPIDVMNMQLQLFMRNARMFQPRVSLLPPILPSLDGGINLGTQEGTFDKLNKAQEQMFDCFSFDEITKKMLDTYIKKNHDYGNAFSEMYDELGINYGYGKIREKVNRIKTLKDNEAQVANEPLEDALLDCANYCILTLIEYQKRKEHGTD